MEDVGRGFVRHGHNLFIVKKIYSFLCFSYVHISKKQTLNFKNDFRKIGLKFFLVLFVLTSAGKSVSYIPVIHQPAPGLSFTKTDVACFGGTNGTIHVIVTGAVGPVTYLWDDGPTSQDRTNLAAGNYHVVVTDNNGPASLSVTITQPAILSATVTSTNVTCNGANNGTITITNPQGGYGTYEYSINGGSNWQASGSFSGLANASYNVKIRDAANTTCVITLNNALSITQPAVLTATVTSTNVTCNGANNGTITITNPQGGYGTYGFSINGGTSWQSSGTFTSLANATYNVKIRDAANTGCIVTLNNALVITQPAVLSATVTYNNITCFGSSDGTITISNPQGGYGTYEYSINGGTSWQASGNFTGLGLATYNVKIRDAANTACVNTLNNALVIIQPAILSATVTSGNVTCNGANNGTITITNPQGGYATYGYSINGGTTWQSSGSFTGLANATYSVKIRDAANQACVITLNNALVITQPAVLSATVNSTNVTCNGASNGTITISNPQGGYGTYEYSINGGSTWQASGSFTGLANAGYSVKIRDAANPACVTTLNNSLVITQPVVLSATLASTNLTCNGAANGTITISNPQGGYGTYGYSINGGANWQASGTFTGLANATYNVQIRDAANPACVVTLNSSLAITQPAVLSATVTSTNVTCYGAANGTITISNPQGGSGSYEYSINGGTNWQASGNFTSLGNASYSVKIRDAVNTACIITLNNALIITQPAVLSATVNSSNVSCNGAGNGIITITNPQGGYGTYEYSINGGSSWQGSGSFINLVNATYSVKIRDAANAACVIVLNNALVITQPAVLSATVNFTNVTCNGANNGAITITNPQGGYGTYEYSINGGTSWQASGNFIGLANATYNVKIRDAANTACVITLNNALSITQPAVLSATVTPTNITCNGANNGIITITNPQGGYGTYQYSINGGSTWQASGTFTGLANATYNVQIRDAANTTCVITLNNALVITQPAVLSATVSSSNVTCNGASNGTITITNPQGGYGTYGYSINGGASWQGSGTFTGLANATYNVQIRDAANTTCIITLNNALIITQPAVLSATVTSTNVTCNGASNGTITISNPQGGYGTYGYSINGGSTWQGSGTFTGLANATYNVQIRDAANTACVITLNSALIITQPAVLSATVTSTNVTCNGANNGTITITNPQGGYGTYGYSINGGTNWQASGNFTGLANSTYNVQIRDAANTSCVVTLNNALIITQPAVLSATVTSTNVTCNGAGNGTITISNPQGGYGTYEYSINGGTSWQAGGTFTGLPNATYNVKIRDAANITCVITLNNALIITQPAVLSATVTFTNVSCNGANNGTITITNPQGGYGTYEYSINGGTSWQASGSFTSLANATYVVMIRDAAYITCVITLNNSLIITQPAVLSATVNSTNVTCNGANNGTITITNPQGGYGTYEYSINGGTSWQVSGIFTNLANATYNVQMRDAAHPGCILVLNSTLIITQPPVLAISSISSNSPICQGSNLNLTVSVTGGTPVYSYAWTGPAGFVSAIQNPGIINAPPGASGVYTVIVTDSNGCTVTAYTTVVVNIVPIVNDPADQVVCNSFATTPVTFTGTGTSYTWTNNNTTIGLPSSGAGNIAAFTAINSSILPVVASITVTPIYSNAGLDCYGSPQTFTITVNPTPSTSVAPASQTLCSPAAITVGFTSNVTVATFSWNIAISPPGSISGAGSGVGNTISQTLVNTSPLPATITYTISSVANGCIAATVTAGVTVNPTPLLSSALTTGICSNILFSYTPTSLTPGTTFSWTRAAVLGIQNLASSGTGPINETLINITGTPKTVTYIYTLTANGCVHTQNVDVTVYPLPTLLSLLLPPAVCSNTLFNYVAVASITGTTLTWQRDAVAGISNPAGTGIGNINETLINTTTTDLSVPYIYTLSIGGCINTVTVTATIKPIPILSSTLTPADICSNSVFSYTPQSNTPGTTFDWSRFPVAGISNGPGSGTGNPNEVLINTTSNPVSVVYVFVLQANTCSNSQNVTVIVKPNATVIPIANQEFCNGATTPVITLSGPVSGTTFTWSNSNTAIGLGASGSGNLPSFIATNSTSSPISASITITPSANGCTGTPLTFLVLVNPTPLANIPANQAICNGANSVAITFSGTFATISWTNNHPEIGLAASGTGNIGSFAAINTGTSPVVATITVTPHFSQSGTGCDGIPISFQITVNPTPVIAAISNQVVCSNVNYPGIPFSTTATGGSPTFNWTCSSNVGFGTSGTGNIPAYTAINGGSAPVSATVSITATVNGCTGGVTTFTITVNPEPSLMQPSNQDVCNNQVTTPVTFSGTATFYTWTNNNLSIGLAASGTGNIGAFTAINNGSSPVIAIITVIPNYTSGGVTCQGPSKTFNITVNPGPTATISGTVSVCQNAVQPLITFTGSNGNTPYTFTYKINGGVNLFVTTTSGNSVTVSVPTAINGIFVYTLVSVTSLAGCSQAQAGTATVTVAPAPTATISGTTTVCQNAAAPNVTLTGVGGTAPYTFTYQVNGGANQVGTTTAGNSLTVSAPTAVIGSFIYSLVNVTSSTGCMQAQSGSATITVSPAPTATISGTTAVCQNAPSPVITFTGANTTAPYTFVYNINGGSNQSITTVSGNSITLNVPTGIAGTFNYNLISVSGASGCSQLISGLATVTVNPSPVLTSSLTPPGICSNTVFNYPHTFSIPGTTFLWTRNVIAGISNGAASSSDDYPDEILFNTTFNPIEVSYNYTITANGCITNQVVKVNVTQTPLLTSTLSPPNICSGTSFSYVPASNVTGTVFTWQRAATGGNPAASGIGNPNEILINNTTNPLGFTYTYTLGSNQCVNPTLYNVTVVVIPAPVVTASASKTMICPGESINLSSFASMPINLLPVLLAEDFNSAANGATTGPNGWTTTNTSTSPPANAAFTVHQNGYNYSGTVFHSNDNSNFYISNSQALGNGTTTNTTLISPVLNTIGYSSLQLNFYHYYFDRGASQGDYAYIEVSTNGGTSWITAPSLMTYNTTRGTATAFQSEAINLNSYVNVSNLRIRFRYTATYDRYWAIDNVSISGTAIVPAISWTSNPTGFTSNIANPTNVVPAATTIYTANYTDPATNCTGNDTVKVTIRQIPAPVITADYCSLRPRVKLTTTAFSSYVWSTGETTQSIIVDIAGNYTVVVTDAFGCQGSGTILVAEELVTDGSFTGFNAAAPAFFTEYHQQQSYYSGVGTSGLWPEGYYAVNTSAWSAYPSAPQGYHPNFHGRDHTNNVSGTRNYLLVNGSTTLTGTPPRQMIIWQQTVNIVPNTDYYFSAWAMNLNPASPAQLQFEVNGVLVGTVADLNVAPKPTTEAQVDLTNWVRFYSNPLWNSGAATTAVIRIRNLNTTAGGNDFGLDDISFGTLASIPFTITATNNSPVCSGGALQLTSTTAGGKPPITYSWSGPNSFTSNLANPVINNVSSAAAGTYTLSVVDGYNCPPEIKTTIVTLNTTPVIPDRTALICSGQNFNATPVNGVPTSATIVPAGTVYTWAAPTINPPGSITGSAAGTNLATISQTLTNTTGSPATVTYNVTPTAGGCPGVVFRVVVTVNAAATVNPGVAQQVCAGNTIQLNGSIGGSATSGSWSGGTGTFTPNVNALNAIYTPSPAEVTAGSVILTLTSNDPDGAGPCSAVNSNLTITINPKPVLSSTNLNVSCYGTSTGAVDLAVSAGTPAYSYIWTASNLGVVPPGQANNQDLAGLVAGTYTVMVNDSKSCSATLSVNITQPVLLEVQESHANVPCAGGVSSVTITAIGGTTPYTGTGTFPQPVGVQTYTVTDAKGCIATIVVTVVAAPNTAPVITSCPVARVFNGCSTNDITGPSFSVVLTNSSYAVFNDANNLGVANDNCAITSVKYIDIANAGCPIVVTRTWTLSDASGLSTNCQQNIQVRDNNAPTWTTAIAFLNRTVECSDANALNAAQALFPVATDNCDADVSNIVKIPGIFVSSLICQQEGSYTNTWTVSDDCGNISAVYTQVINVTDNIAPVWITAAGTLDRTLECSDNVAIAAAQALVPVASDLCDANVSNIVKVSGPFVGSGGCINQGTYTNTWSVTDDCGNVSGIFAQVIHIIDTISPTWLTAPNAINVPLDCNDASGLATAQALFPVAADNCDPDVSNIVKTSGPFVPSVGCPQAGTYTNTWRSTDDCGNVSLAYTQVITLRDVTGPLVYCPPNDAFPCDAPNFNPSLTGTAVAVDNCDPNPVLTYHDSIVPGGCAGNYQILRAWKATDACGNFNSCQQILFIQDVILPTITCPVAGNQDIFPNVGGTYIHPDNSWDASGSDNCSGIVLTASLTGATIAGPFPTLNGVLFNEGFTTVTWTAVDGCSNRSVCQFTVTLTSVPDITCSADITRNTDPGLCTTSIDPGAPVKVIGTEPVTYTWSMTGATVASGSGRPISPLPYLFNAGVTTIRWIASNISGSDTCEQLITVIDNEPPTFSALPVTYCVEDIHLADYWDPTIDITPTRPDFYLVKAGDYSLDVTGLHDNCCAPASIIVNWRIDFVPTPDTIPPFNLVNTPPLTGTGQPSAFGTDIHLPGDGHDFLDITHTITYWATDCNGNVSSTSTMNIVVRPRANVIKQ